LEDNRDAAAVRIFPPVIPALIILLGIGLNYVWPIDLALAISKPLRFWIGCAIVVSAMLGLGGWSILIMRRDGQREYPWEPTFNIIDHGPFRLTRNPMYLQMVLVCADGYCCDWR